jgi:hypothetical protein
VLPPLDVLPPEGLGAATTGAGADVVVTGGEECVVTGGAAVVVDVVVAGLGFCTVLWCVTAFFVVVVAGSAVAVVVDVVDVVTDAAGVEVVFELVVPPQPATARATAIVLSTIFFISPAPILAANLRVQGTRHLGRWFVPVGLRPN